MRYLVIFFFVVCSYFLSFLFVYFSTVNFQTCLLRMDVVEDDNFLYMPMWFHQISSRLIIENWMLYLVVLSFWFVRTIPLTKLIVWHLGHNNSEIPPLFNHCIFSFVLKNNLFVATLINLKEYIEYPFCQVMYASLLFMSYFIVIYGSSIDLKSSYSKVYVLRLKLIQPIALSSCLDFL